MTRKDIAGREAAVPYMISFLAMGEQLFCQEILVLGQHGALDGQRLLVSLELVAVRKPDVNVTQIELEGRNERIEQH